MVKDLRARNWAAFSRKYNGPSYARRGYHTRMAAAYKKFKAQLQAAAPTASDAVKGKSLKVSAPQASPVRDN